MVESTVSRDLSPDSGSALDLDTIVAWVGRSVRRSDEPKEYELLGPAVVLAVDDMPYAPTAWIKYGDNRRHPLYRSLDLSDLIDIETGEEGPLWGTGGQTADMAMFRAERSAEDKS